MNFKTRFFSVAVVAILLAAMIGVSMSGDSASGGTSESLFSRKTTVRLWYSDDALTDFLNDCAVTYNDAQKSVRIVPTLITDTDYVQSIYDASVEGDEFPDLFVTKNGELGRLYKSGLAAPVDDADRTYFEDGETFPETAVHAVTYHGEIVAWPLGYETSAFLYNTEYLQSMADSLGQTLEETVPQTMLDVIRLANSYDAPEGVTAVMKWDVSDIFYNYCFVGAYMDVGGDDGDDPESLELYNDKLIQCLQVYQQMNQYFAIDSKTDSYEQVLQDFEDGKTVFTLATTGAVRDIAEKTEAGTCSISYGVTAIPDSTDSLESRTMSVTDCLVVNGYSENQDLARNFILYIMNQKMDSFYDMTGRPAAKSGAACSDEHMQGFDEAYQDSVPITKLPEASNFWMLLENTFQDVWDGADCNDALHDLAQETMIQISGTENYKVERIPDPEKIDITSDLTFDSDTESSDAAESSTESSTESAEEAETSSTQSSTESAEEAASTE